MKKILFIGSECMPFAATGGLGDVVGSLGAAIKKKNEEADVRVVLPLYSAVDKYWRSQMTTEIIFTVKLGWRNQYCGILSLQHNGVTYYFVDNEYYFKRDNLYGYGDDGERFAFFSMAAVQMLGEMGYYPDVIHANDWQSAASIVYLETMYKEIPGYDSIKTVFTIHNIEYQGKFPMEIMNDVFGIPWKYAGLLEYEGSLNLVKAAVESADAVTTVSPRYAEEIQTDEYGCSLAPIIKNNAHKLSGILNGIDVEVNNPHTDKVIAKKYMWRSISGKKLNKAALQEELGLPVKDVPVFAIISRLVSHKGMDLVRAVAHAMLFRFDCQIIVLGTGEYEYESFFRLLEDTFPEKARALITYNRDLSRKVYAAADYFVMPSKSEPCGLAQMIASSYGTVPVTRETGGLYDSIKNYSVEKGVTTGNGLTFAEYSSNALYAKIEDAMKLYRDQTEFRKLQQKIMKIDFSWGLSAEKYTELYETL
ncbi:MAG: glycogen synthase GlgA [Clostridia bacterium]|nr:glycogen synthase GlgA [Clostridia bacterium]